jgi:diaminopropionate ammonia-lyase
VVVSTGNYDAAVREMAAAADGQGWTIVSDTAWPGYDTIPRWIMAGYTEIFEEAAAAWTDPPDVVVIQAGVGSLAGAAAAWLHARFGSASRPKLVVAEPTESAVVAASLAAARRVSLADTGETTMVGLRSGEVSSIVWPVLQATVDAAVTVSDDDAARATEALARLDPPIHAGPSGSAGLAGLTRLIADPALHALRRRLSLGRSARCLVVATEGAPPGSA